MTAKEAKKRALEIHYEKCMKDIEFMSVFKLVESAVEEGKMYIETKYFSNNVREALEYQEYKVHNNNTKISWA